MSTPQNRLRTRQLGQYVFVKKSVASTNDWAKQLAKQGATEGTIAIAETQTRGHGRKGRKWFSPKGGLWLSIILKPDLKPSEIFKLVFTASLAVAEAIEELYKVKPETKWPNDVLLHNKKVCGIFAESSITDGNVNYVIMGIGVNADFSTACLPRTLKKSASTLRTELRRHIALEPLLSNILERLEKHYKLVMKGNFRRILFTWKTYASFLEKPVEVSNHHKLHGVAEDIEEDGSLILVTRGGHRKRIRVGDLSLNLGRT